MIKTSGPLKLIEQEGGGWELVEDWWCDLEADLPAVRSEEDGIAITNPAPGIARIYTKAGFEWDGASGPTVDPERWRVPPFVHDELYRLLKYSAWGKLPTAEHDRIRKVADETMLKLLLERLPKNPILRQLAKARAHAWYRSVRMFAGFAARPRPRPKAQRAA